jgi:hypothetical protein
MSREAAASWLVAEFLSSCLSYLIQSWGTIKKKSGPPVLFVGLIGIQVLAPRQGPVFHTRALS